MKKRHTTERKEINNYIRDWEEAAKPVLRAMPDAKIISEDNLRTILYYERVYQANHTTKSLMFVLSKGLRKGLKEQHIKQHVDVDTLAYSLAESALDSKNKPKCTKYVISSRKSKMSTTAAVHTQSKEDIIAQNRKRRIEDGDADDDDKKQKSSHDIEEELEEAGGGMQK